MKYCLAFIILFLPLSIAFAHVEEIDGPISAELHIDPNDAPRPGEESSISFIFKDEEKRLKLQNCECVLTILENENELKEIALSDPEVVFSDSEAVFPYIFPKVGNYFLVISGLPKREAKISEKDQSFYPFSLTFNVKVENVHEGHESFAGKHFLHIIVFLGAFIWIGYIIKKAGKPEA